MRRVHKNSYPATISASIVTANMWKNSLKNEESDNNKILYETLLNSFLQRNGSSFLHKPRNLHFVSKINMKRNLCLPVSKEQFIFHKYTILLPCKDRLINPYPAKV